MTAIKKTKANSIKKIKDHKQVLRFVKIVVDEGASE